MAFLMLIVYFIIVYLRPGEWVPGLIGLQLLDVAMLGATFFLSLRLALTKASDLARLPHNRMMLGLFAAIVLSHLANAYVGGAIHAFQMFLVNVLTYFLVVNIVNSERKVRIILWVLILLTAVLAVQGIQQAATGTGWAGQDLVYGRITWIGIFNDPNDLALTFIMVIPLLLAYLVSEAFIGFKWIALLLLGVLTYGTFLTNSRGAMLALMAAVGFFFIKRSRHRLLGGLLGGTAAAAVFLFGPSRMGMISANEESAAGRLDAWYYGFQLLKHNPFFGAGQDMFTNDYPLTAHNSFVLAFAELGLVGFFIWIGLLYTGYRALSVVQTQRGVLTPYAYGLQASIIGFCVGAFFLSRTYILIPYLLVALSGAVSGVVARQTPALTFRFTKRDWWNIFRICLGVFILLEIAMKVWR